MENIFYEYERKSFHFERDSFSPNFFLFVTEEKLAVCFVWKEIMYTMWAYCEWIDNSTDSSQQENEGEGSKKCAAVIVQKMKTHFRFQISFSTFMFVSDSVCEILLKSISIFFSTQLKGETSQKFALFKLPSNLPHTSYITVAKHHDQRALNDATAKTAEQRNWEHSNRRKTNELRVDSTANYRIPCIPLFLNDL